MKRYRTIAVLLILTLSLLSVRIFYINYFNSRNTTASIRGGTEVFGTKRGLIFDRNLKPLVETQKKARFSVENPSFSILVPQRYADEQLCEHFIGYVNAENNGVCGIEADYNSFLKAIPNEIRLQTYRDANGKLLKGKGTQADTSKLCKKEGLALTIHKEIQSIVENYAGSVEKGAACVLDAQSGDILASASFPQFEPNAIENYLNDPDNALLNRVLMRYNVGSVFKVVICMAALENGISPDFSYTCNGKINCGSHVFHCHKTEGHGKLKMREALAFSCNTYFIALAQKTGKEAILKMCRKLQVNQSTPLSESIIIPAATLPDARNLSSSAALANFSFGQGELSASPLMIANIYSVIASGGYLVKNRLILSTVHGGKLKAENTVKNRVIKQSTAKLIQEYLTYTVTNGTGKNAACDFVIAAGKTATAQTGKFFGKEEVLISYFVGYISIKGDIYTILVMKEGGHSGSLDCAPIFRQIAEGIYRLGQ